LRRSEESTDQSLAIFRKLKQAGAQDPCSEDNIRLMGKLDLGSEQVQAVGYVRDDHLLCSSYGKHNTSVGPPLYTTPYGTQTRVGVEFPVLPGIRFLLITDVQSGYSAAIHPNLTLDVFSSDPEISVGVFSTVSKKSLINRGAVKQQWLGALGNGSVAQFVDDEYVVAIARSEKYALAAYATVPTARITAGLWRNAVVLVPIGAIAGLVLALAVAYLTRQQMSMRALIKGAIRRNEFFLEYQPIVELRDEQCIGAEALIRWRRPDGRTIPPDLFIAAAEETGQIHEITKRVMEIVARDAATLLMMRPELHIAINLSATDLQMEETNQLLRDLIRRMGVQPHNILVEATERGFMQGEMPQRIMEDMRAFNMQIAIDDFGTGYSSLSYLQKFKLDYLKIDKSFVDTMGGEAATSQVAHHIIEMAKSLNLKMIAEGVETEGQLRYLQEHGVQYAQGWLFSKSLPFEEFASFVIRLEKTAVAK
jgi:sensor c-di-GMP phosphodiesterase-like protein